MKTVQVLEQLEQEAVRRPAGVMQPGWFICVVNSPISAQRQPAAIEDETREPVTIDVKPESAPGSHRLFVPGRDEPIDEDKTIFRSPWVRHW